MDLVAVIITTLRHSLPSEQTQHGTLYAGADSIPSGPEADNLALGSRDYLIASVADMYPLSQCPSPLPEDQDPGEFLLSDCAGVEPKILRIIAEKLNLTVKYKRLGDGPWGSQMPNGSWNGHIGRILRGEADLAIGSITQTYARYKAVDFSHPVAQDYYTFTVPPIEELPKYDAFLRPFTLQIWCCIFFSLIAVAAAQTLINNMAEPQEPRRRRYLDPVKDEESHCNVSFHEGSTLPRVFLHALESATSDAHNYQGLFASSDEGTRRARGKHAFAMLTGTWIVVTTVIAQIYSAVILAFLITPAFPPGIRTLYDGVHLSQARFIATKIDGALTEYITQSSTIEGSLFQTIIDQNRLVVCESDRIRCSKLDKDFVLSPKYLAERYKANYSSQGHTLNLADERLLVSSFAWPIKGGNPLIPRLNDYLIHAEAGGIIQNLFERERRNYLKMFPPINAKAAAAVVEDDDGDDVRATSQGLALGAVETLSFEEFEGVFVIYGIGLGLAFGAFLLEVLLGRTLLAED